MNEIAVFGNDGTLFEESFENLDAAIERICTYLKDNNVDDFDIKNLQEHNLNDGRESNFSPISISLPLSKEELIK